MTAPRVLVVFTGGTIGSHSGDDPIGVVAGQTYALLDHFRTSEASSLVFDVIEPVNILSEDAHPSDWIAVADAINSATRTQSYNGVVVTHGTDTLAFTSAALSFALADFPAPIVLVSSNHPLDDARANGHRNFADAIRFILDVETTGVFVVYVNPDGRRLVHRGTRVGSASPLDHFFKSVCSQEFGEFGDSGFTLRADSTETDHPLPAIPRAAEPLFNDAVLFVRPYPGLNYSVFELSGVSAVVHDVFHSGTANSSAERPEASIIGLASRCREASIPLFLVSIPAGLAQYESARDFKTAGIAMAKQIRAETALVKVMYGIGIGLRGADLEDFVCRQNIAHEFIPAP